MIIEVVPAPYSSANGDLIYNVYDAKADDKTTYPDYKYVLDIYVDGILVGTHKAAPYPGNNRGVFNIGSVVRNYIGAQFLDLLPHAPDVIWFNNGSFYAKVVVKVGEEYGGVLTTNIVTDAERRFYNTYNGRLNGKYTILPDYLEKFATTRPLTKGNKARIDTPHFFIPYISRVEDWTHYRFRNNLGYSFDGQFYSGGVGWLIGLDIGPKVFNTLAASVGSVAIDKNTLYYDFQVDNGPEIRINIYDERKNKPHTIHFLNRFGGLETFEFSKKSVSRLEIEAKGVGIQRAKTDGTTFNGLVVNDNYKQYATSYNEKLSLSSGNIHEDHYKWLAELVLSPQKWLEEDGFLVPVTVTNTSYEFKTRANNNASSNQLTIELSYNETLNTQYL